MKRILFTILVVISGVLSTKADSLWIEADAKGQVGKPQTIKVIFGSYGLYRLQKTTTEDFQQVKDFTCWAISPTGKHIALTFSPKETDYQAKFTPEEKGIYVFLLECKQRRVEDWSKSSTKIGVAKQHYYGRTTVQVGESETVAPAALSDLSLVQNVGTKAGADVTLQVLLHGKPVPNATLLMRHPEMPEQKLTTDENGNVSFHAPKAGRYFALVTLKFEQSGTFRGVHYDVFREKASATMLLE
jgi:uncharacterized GH25 family protein